jgi:hypothetical protein
VKRAAIIGLILLSAYAFYYSMYLGWASGTGTHDQPNLKFGSNVALGVSFVLFWTGIGIWFVPHLLKIKKRRAEAASSNVNRP